MTTRQDEAKRAAPPEPSALPRLRRVRGRRRNAPRLTTALDSREILTSDATQNNPRRTRST